MSANTLDGVPITVCVAFMFKPSAAHLYDLTKTYKNWDGYLKVLKWRSRSAIRHACSEFETKDFQTRRAVVQATMDTRVREEISPTEARPSRKCALAERACESASLNGHLLLILFAATHHTHRPSTARLS